MRLGKQAASDARLRRRGRDVIALRVSKEPTGAVRHVGRAACPNGHGVFVESGGDNLSATFSPELSDLTVYVIDVSAGDKIPRKGGPGITKSDLLIINKIDLAPFVGASLEVMENDALRMRQEKPFIFSNFKTGLGVDGIIKFITTEGML